MKLHSALRILHCASRYLEIPETVEEHHIMGMANRGHPQVFVSFAFLRYAQYLYVSRPSRDIRFKRCDFSAEFRASLTRGSVGKGVQCNYMICVSHGNTTRLIP